MNRWANKQTYDPELEKQIAEERKRARESRGKFREGLDSAIAANQDLIKQDKLTTLGASQSAALFKTANDWLSATPDATSEEIEDKAMETTDKLKNIYNEDKNRLYFATYLKTTETILKVQKTNNQISEDVFKKGTEIIDREKKFLDKNPSESLQIYKQHLETASDEISKLLNDPELQKKMRQSQNEVNSAKNLQDVEEKQKKLEEDAKAKEELQKREFNISRLFTKIGSGFFWAFWISVVLALGFFGASIASNEAVVRPTSYRILYFIYGFIFFPVVLLYSLYRTFQGKPPYFAALLIPLYEYDPLKEKKDSFLQRLVWFKNNAIIQDAQKTFQQAAVAGQGLQLDFTAIAKEALKV